MFHSFDKVFKSSQWEIFLKLCELYYTDVFFHEYKEEKNFIFFINIFYINIFYII